MIKPITLIGGGLAGLTLGIGLRQHGVPVTIVEAGHYPRHRVCGEFISGRGLAALSRLGVQSALLGWGARTATTAAFFSAGSRASAHSLPQASISISRFVLDAALARMFSDLGGELRTGERWTSPMGEGMVRTSGRRPEATTQGWRWFGLKVHARNLSLTADLEMHFVPAGYVGLNQLSGDEVNVCGLFRSATAVPDRAQGWRVWLRGPDGSTLQSRLASAHFIDDSFTAIAGLSLRSRRARTRPEACLGDALTMIPPLTGNGMSMAFEAAELAREPLRRYSQEGQPWAPTQQAIARACDAAFGRRLRWAGWLQAAMFYAPARSAVFALARAEPLWRGLFRQTR